MTFLRHVATRGHSRGGGGPPITHAYNLPAAISVVTWLRSHQTFILGARRHGTPAVRVVPSRPPASLPSASSPYLPSLPLHLALMHRHGISLAYCCCYSCRYTVHSLSPHGVRSPLPFLAMASTSREINTIQYREND